MKVDARTMVGGTGPNTTDTSFKVSLMKVSGLSGSVEFYSHVSIVRGRSGPTLTDHFSVCAAQ